MHKDKAGALLLIVIFALFLQMSISAETFKGAKGFSYKFSNPSYTLWYYPDITGIDTPHTRCHVSALNDGSWPGGWHAAQIDTSGKGDWVELSVCDTVDGYPKGRIRVNSRSSVTITDPLENPNYLPTQEEGCDCSVTIEQGTQVWMTGPEDPTLDWPPMYISWDLGSIFPDTVPEPPLPPWEYVVDYEETGVMRVTNHPYAGGIVLVTLFPDSIPYTVLPGESKRFMPDGTLGENGNVLVYPARDTFAHADETVELDFELWNLFPDTVRFFTEAEDTDGWPLMVSDPIVTVPPASYVIVTVTATVENPGLPSNMVTLRATDISDNSQTHWGAAFINVLLEPTDAGDQVPATAWLGQCRPNPFNPTTEIPFKLSARSRIRISVYDASGKFITTLAEGPFSTGWHTVAWNGKNLSGRDVESGVYFCRLELENGKSMVRKMVLIR